MGYKKTRRAEIDKIITLTRNNLKLRGKKIDTIDPLLTSTRNLYPYLTEKEVYDYATLALRVIKNKQFNVNQPHLTFLYQY